MERYIVQFWDDKYNSYGVYDAERRCFVGDKIVNQKDAINICKWYAKLMEGKQ